MLFRPACSHVFSCHLLSHNCISPCRVWLTGPWARVSWLAWLVSRLSKRLSQSHQLRVRVRKQGVVSVVAEQWKMHACKSQQRMVQCGHVFLQGSIVRAALARLFCSALLAQLPFHPSYQARRRQMMLGAMRHHVQHLLQIGVHCDVHVVVLVGECVAGPPEREKYVESTGASRAL